MIEYEDNCVGCRDMGLGCRGLGCPNINVKVYICDCCGEYADELYEYGGGQWCIECIKDDLIRVE